MPLQSGIFTMNRKMFIGLVSSIITAGLGYGIRLILLNYLEYDVFTHLDNWSASLSYFCSLGAIRFLINEWLKENTFLLSYGGNRMEISNNTAGSCSLPVGSKAAEYNSSMQAPNNSAIASSSAGDPPITDERSKLESRIAKIEKRLPYFHEQVEGCKEQLMEITAMRAEYRHQGLAEQWQKMYDDANTALEGSYKNLHWDLKMQGILRANLANGNYAIPDTSATKRVLTDSSMGNDASSRPNNARRRLDNP